MPGWPSPAERRALDAFPEQIGPEDLDEHFKLSPADMRFALRHRGDSRLGVAVQLCALRWLGFVPEALTEIPQPAVLELCDQLEANPADLDTYGARSQTRSDQLAAASTHAGFRPWDAPEPSALEAWLTVRAMEHERPKALFTLAAEQLHVQRIARPSVDQLVRLIGAARERAHQATFDALADQLTDRALKRPLGQAARAARRWHDMDRVATHPRAGRVAQVHPAAAGEVHLPARARRRPDRPVNAPTGSRADARR